MYTESGIRPEINTRWEHKSALPSLVATTGLIIATMGGVAHDAGGIIDAAIVGRCIDGG